MYGVQTEYTRKYFEVLLGTFLHLRNGVHVLVANHNQENGRRKVPEVIRVN